MKTPATFALLAILTLNLAGCATPAERKRQEARRAREDAQREVEHRRREHEDARRDRQRDAERAREDARRDAEHREREREDVRRDRRRDAEDYERFLFGFARDLGKTPSELSSLQRADARRAFELRYGRR